MLLIVVFVKCKSVAIMLELFEKEGAMLLEGIKKAKLVAIVRGVEPKDAASVAKALFEGGVRFMEVTMNSPSPADSIREMRFALQGLDAHVGAGTVSSLKRLEEAAGAGAEFIIAPDANSEVIRETKRLGLLSIPGFMTPTEAFRAQAAGADILKLFPCGSLGPGYLKDLKAVLDAPVMAVGGVDESNIASWLKLACAVGVGSSLYKPGLSPEALKVRALAYSTIAKQELP